MRITESVAHAIAHVQTWWQPPSRTRELARQYKAMAEAAPLAIADLMRFCLMFDDVHAPGDSDLTMVNIGKRQAGLHLAAMLDLQPEDLQHLRQETEDDGRPEPE